MSLYVDNVSKAFNGVPAVAGVSLEVQPGEIFGFLGPNGAGKTTTIRMILNIYHPDSGRILWNGQPAARAPRRIWGYLPEERGLYPKMPVAEQLLFLARLYGRPRAAAQREVDRWLERLQVTQNRTKRVEELSKGNQQKVQFLAAILHDPDILLMDEPFSGLDPVNEKLLKDILVELHTRGQDDHPLHPRDEHGRRTVRGHRHHQPGATGGGRRGARREAQRRAQSGPPRAG